MTDYLSLFKMNIFVIKAYVTYMASSPNLAYCKTAICSLFLTKKKCFFLSQQVKFQVGGQTLCGRYLLSTALLRAKHMYYKNIPKGKNTLPDF